MSAYKTAVPQLKEAHGGGWQWIKGVFANSPHFSTHAAAVEYGETRGWKVPGAVTCDLCSDPITEGQETASNGYQHSECRAELDASQRAYRAFLAENGEG